MFSITKVKLHGMQDERWTTMDKLMQYRGLINLYMRDRKIMEYDKAAAKKTHVKDLKRLQKLIVVERQSLDNAIHGDRQKVRNTLAEDKSLQLAYQHLHPTKIVDHIYQENFNKRKELDRIFFKQKMKTEELVTLKLELADLQDRLTDEGPGKIQVEIDAGIITGKVQDAILKKEAAITVQQTYINIINIMKQDRIYYDAVLNSLKQDCISQGTCLLHTTEMGQLATEYLDDRRDEYHEMERHVRASMKQRVESLEEVSLQVESMLKNVKNLVRRDSDVDVMKRLPTSTASMDRLEEDITFTSGLLSQLKDATVVSSFQAIYPTMVEQRRQNDRLRQLFNQNVIDRDRLLNKENHATLMLDNLMNTMVENTLVYRQEKADLLKTIREKHKKRKLLIDMIRRRGELMVNIRISLQQLQTITMPVVLGGQPRKAVGIAGTITTNTAPKHVETDVLQLIEILSRRLTVLAGIKVVDLDSRKSEEAEMLFQKLMLSSQAHLAYTQELDEGELLDGIIFEDGQLPTRESIRAKSAEIVEMHERMLLIEANTVLVVDKKTLRKVQGSKKAK